MKLVIVESPTKARKLSTYLGKGYQVESSVGHVRDLPKSGLGVDVDGDFEPEYVVSEGKTKVVRLLKKAAKSADSIVLAMDPDREGEAIAWHVASLLGKNPEGVSSRGKRKNDEKFSRVTFNEITKTAVLTALDKPGQINMHLVDAQQARRVVDRLVGYKVSPVLWRKVRRGLSAGRVQSVALRLIVEREREIEAFKPDEYWELDVGLNTVLDKKTKSKLFVEGKIIDELPDGVLVARVVKVGGKKFEPKTKDDTDPVVATLKKSTTTYAVDNVERKERKRQSLPPFTTSTLQQTSSSRLGYSGKRTMQLAQQLYEEGLITYHRTDSFTLSKQALDMARGFIEKSYGPSYLPSQPRVFRNKSKNAQEAHEAIRVTDITCSSSSIPEKGAKLTQQHAKLYDLIWKRFVASQMESAVYDQTKITTQFAGQPGEKVSGLLSTTGSVLKFDGWTRLFAPKTDTLLPKVEKGQQLDFIDLNAAQKFTQPPPRYNDASLVKELEKRGIGRPSTYASIISVIIDRGYVEREQKRFIASTVGMTVSDFLLDHFKSFMEYDFTAEMEEDLDRISRGEKEWRKVVGVFYKPFAKKIEEVTETAERVKIPVEETGEQCPDCMERKKSGVIPEVALPDEKDKDKKSKTKKSKKDAPPTAIDGVVVIRTGRFGKFKSCSRFPDCRYTENLVEVIEGVTCPLCQKGDVVAKKSRWGKPFFGCKRYPECDWASWKKPEPGETITKAAWKKHQEERAERKKKWAESRQKGKKKVVKKKAKKVSRKNSVA